MMERIERTEGYKQELEGVVTVVEGVMVKRSKSKLVSRGRVYR
jgi:hypothetical protein